MAGAGFYAIHTDTIAFAKDGRWYADGEPVLHPRLALLFSRHLRRKPDGSYEINIDDQYRADVVVEDTPFVVTGVDVAGTTITVHLNDDTSEALDPNTLTSGRDDVLYCRVKGGQERARFLRSPYMHLAPAIDTDAAGRFVVRLGGADFPIRRCG